MLKDCFSFVSFLKIGFTLDGKIKAFDIKLYSNAGNSLDLSKYVSIVLFCTRHKYVVFVNTY